VGAKDRQARLRREYAAWYPTIGVTAWMRAQSAANAVTRQLMEGEPPWAPRWALGQRVLDDRHFVFRGGVDRAATERTRAGDISATRPRGIAPPRPSHPHLVQGDVT
jgi:hypothetical protein